ncbi:MAG: penicillin-binding transpeptidase domain-containing protein [Actinobacteria bacterium]|nr:penicillin-binding transpeptidase domain-containing protein [Actinomycetota bacterium]
MASEWFGRKRIAIIFMIMAVCFAGLLFRLSWLQLVKGGELSRKAEEVRAKDEIVDSSRGTIYDRNHIELVGNSPVKSIYINPDTFSFKVSVEPGEDKKEKEKVLREKIISHIAVTLGLDEAAIKIFDSGQRYARLKRSVDYDTCKKLEDIIKEYKISGIGFEEGTARSYPQGSMASHVLGFMGLDPSARGGLEKTYDRELAGTPGHLVTESDAQGRELPQTKSGFLPPVPGKNLILTIDRTIQYYVERELDKAVEQYQPSKAVIIVMDPSSGEILAMGSRPGYEPARYSSFPQQVWDFNPALRYNYEPGSTLKMFVAAMALEEGKVSEGDTFYDPGYIMINNRRINCWDRTGHGAETFAEGVQNSCNPVFIATGLRTGKELMFKYLQGFGFGQGTGVDLPGEDVGLVIPEERASELDLATMSIGQSIAVTPIQLITAVSSLANGGTLIKPHLVRGLENPATGEVANIEPQQVRQVVSKGTAQKMSRLLQRVILEGSGKKAYVEGYTVAGKTGTAQVPGQRGYEEGKYVASFAGFAPADNPRLAVLVMIAEPKGGQYYGSEVAAPIFQAVARESLHYLNVPENPGLPGPKSAVIEEEKPPVPEADRKVHVPNVVGYPVEDASGFLEERGLRPAPSGRAGVVVEQKPAGGSLEPRGAAVALKIAAAGVQGSAQDVIVPDLTGLTIRRSGTMLQRLGLNFSSAGSGYAVSQKPLPGQRVARGTLVTAEFGPAKNY